MDEIKRAYFKLASFEAAFSELEATMPMLFEDLEEYKENLKYLERKKASLERRRIAFFELIENQIKEIE